MDESIKKKIIDEIECQEKMIDRMLSKSKKYEGKSISDVFDDIEAAMCMLGINATHNMPKDKAITIMTTIATETIRWSTPEKIYLMTALFQIMNMEREKALAIEKQKQKEKETTYVEIL